MPRAQGHSETDDRDVCRARSAGFNGDVTPAPSISVPRRAEAPRSPRSSGVCAMVSTAPDSVVTGPAR